MSKADELLKELHTQFPELNEANVAGAVAGSLGKSVGRAAYNVATKVPIVGGLVKGVGNALGMGQPAPTQPSQAAPASAAPAPQKQGLMQGIGGAIGGAIKAGVDAHQANKAAAASQPSQATSGEDDMSDIAAGPGASGLEGFEVSIEDAYKAIEAFAQSAAAPAPEAKPTQPAPTAPAPAQKQTQSAIRDYSSLLQELSSIYEADQLPPEDPEDQKPAQPQGQQAKAPDPAMTQKFQNYAKNMVAKVKKNGGDILKDDQMLKALVAFVNEAQVAGIQIPGLENINAKNLQAAIDQEKQAAGNAEQQVGQMTDDQVQQLIAGMDRRALKQAVLSNPELAKQLVAGLGKQQPAQQPANPSNTAQQ